MHLLVGVLSYRKVALQACLYHGNSLHMPDRIRAELCISACLVFVNAISCEYSFVTSVLLGYS